jgi:hypothetical protein
MKPQRAWEKIFLPRWEKTEWTWRRIFLLSVAVILLIDSFFVPFSRHLDPGRSGEGILFLIVGFRAASKSELPISVVVMGTCLAALAISMNHGLLKSPSLVWTSLAILLTALVFFWGRGNHKQVDRAVAEDSTSTQP